MYISYFDEAGDDGYPKYSSDLFVLTSIYMHHNDWKTNYEKVENFRKQLKIDYNFPVKYEFHTKDFLTDKNPYRELNLTYDQKREIIFNYFNLISIMDLNIINVVINKHNIKTEIYDVLENAMKYNIQRIENDVKSKSIDNKFIIITDEGRIKKMTSITRKIQKFNIIPSKYNTGLIRNDIEKLIEDPLPKKSTESYFIQVSDAVSYIIYLYSLKCFIKKDWANRVTNILKHGDDEELLTKIESNLNLKASSNRYGIVHYPK